MYFADSTISKKLKQCAADIQCQYLQSNTSPMYGRHFYVNVTNCGTSTKDNSRNRNYGDNVDINVKNIYRPPYINKSNHLKGYDISKPAYANQHDGFATKCDTQMSNRHIFKHKTISPDSYEYLNSTSSNTTLKGSQILYKQNGKQKSSANELIYDKKYIDNPHSACDRDYVVKLLQRNARLRNIIETLVVQRQEMRHKKVWNEFINNLKEKHGYVSDKPIRKSTPSNSNNTIHNTTNEYVIKDLLSSLYHSQGLLQPNDPPMFKQDYDSTSLPHKKKWYHSQTQCYPTSSLGRYLVLQKKKELQTSHVPPSRCYLDSNRLGLWHNNYKNVPRCSQKMQTNLQPINDDDKAFNFSEGENDVVFTVSPCSSKHENVKSERITFTNDNRHNDITRSSTENYTFINKGTNTNHNEEIPYCAGNSNPCLGLVNTKMNDISHSNYPLQNSLDSDRLELCYYDNYKNATRTSQQTQTNVKPINDDDKSFNLSECEHDFKFTVSPCPSTRKHENVKNARHTFTGGNRNIDITTSSTENYTFTNKEISANNKEEKPYCGSNCNPCSGLVNTKMNDVSDCNYSMQSLEQKLDILIESFNRFTLAMKENNLKERRMAKENSPSNKVLNKTKSDISRDSCIYRGITRKNKSNDILFTKVLHHNANNSEISGISIKTPPVKDSYANKLDKIAQDNFSKNDLITRTIENLLINRKNEQCSAHILTIRIPVKEICTQVSKSLSKTHRTSEKNFMAEELDWREDNDNSKYQPMPSMAIAVNTEPLGLFALLRISVDAVKQFLSYVPYLNNHPILTLAQQCGLSSHHFVCDICGATFNRPSHLSNHIQRQHNLGKTRDCCICHHVIDMQRNQRCLFKCKYCGQRFARAYCCELHQQTCAKHHGLRHDVPSELALLR